MTILDDKYEFTDTQGKTQYLERITIRDLIRFTRWVQYKPYRDACDAQLPEKELKKIKSECSRGITIEEVKDENDPDNILKKEFGISPTSTIVREELLSLEGFYRMLEIQLEKVKLPYSCIDDKLASSILEEYLEFNKLLKPKEERKETVNPTK